MSQPPQFPKHRSLSTPILVVGTATFLYFTALLAISPYASGASHNLFDWPYEAASTAIIPQADVLFPAVARLGLVEKSTTPTRLEYAIKVAGFIETVFKIVGLVVGGLFAYWT